ncbi:MAG TPA: glycoside hydrolase family 2 TIM barrel-domain containing protein [Acidobacteriota bacterium]|nr:glycoside hydrolase family 2 TIM barrel-domain containing protein [Acidobacteriota bacterium]
MRHWIWGLFLICLIPGSPKASEKLIINIDGRQTTSLNGAWQIIIDPYENGYFNYRWEPDPNGYFKNEKPKDKTDRVEYDFDASETLLVPGDWNTQKEKLFLYEGTIWYKKSFDFKLKPNRRVFVWFGAANYHAIAYLNGQKLGEHLGGFTPFNFEITRLLKEKDNFLVVKVDNKRQRDGVPTLNTDWFNYGGLTRQVYLAEAPQTFIRDYFIQLKPGSEQEIAGWVQLDGAKPSQPVKIEIPEAGINISVQTGEQGFASFNRKASLQLWSPDNPKLYQVVLQTESDRVTDAIGFRSIATRGHDILLNGKPLFLRGISIHEEAPVRGGRAFSREDARILLGWAKELGCNFVRLAHYPHNENMIRMADEMGLLVWSEIPVYWTILWENEQTYANAARQLTENITRDKNRASIILWSVANETPPGEPRLKFLKGLAKTAKAMDPTRLTTAAMERHSPDATTQMIDDPLGEFLDVLGCNEYIGWYDGLPAKADTMTWKMKYAKPLIISEFGGDARYGLHGDELTRWSEEYQADLYEHTLRMLDKIPFLRGVTPWILMDFRSPRRPLPGIQDFWNRKGLISNRGEKKKAFQVLKKYYEGKQTNPRF